MRLLRHALKHSAHHPLSISRARDEREERRGRHRAPSKKLIRLKPETLPPPPPSTPPAEQGERKGKGKKGERSKPTIRRLFFSPGKSAANFHRHIYTTSSSHEARQKRGKKKKEKGGERKKGEGTTSELLLSSMPSCCHATSSVKNTSKTTIRRRKKKERKGI